MTTLVSMRRPRLPPRLREGAWWPVRRRWMRMRSMEILPDQLRAGDKLFYDHPETGPYWTQPITSIEPTEPDNNYFWLIGYETTTQTFPLKLYTPLRVYATSYKERDRE